MTGSSPPEPSPTRAVLEVWAEPAEGATPGFGWTNGVALGLVLVVDALFAAALLRGAWHESLLAWWALGLYAGGLTFGVAWVRPLPRFRRAFGLVLAPVLFQLLVFLAFWARHAGLVEVAPAAGWEVVPARDVFVGLCFVFGGVFATGLPFFTRRHLPLVFTELAPLAFALVAALSM